VHSNPSRTERLGYKFGRSEASELRFEGVLIIVALFLAVAAAYVGSTAIL